MIAKRVNLVDQGHGHQFRMNDERSDGLGVMRVKSASIIGQREEQVAKDTARMRTVVIEQNIAHITLTEAARHLGLGWITKDRDGAVMLPLA